MTSLSMGSEAIAVSKKTTSQKVTNVAKRKRTFKKWLTTPVRKFSQAKLEKMVHSSLSSTNSNNTLASSGAGDNVRPNKKSNHHSNLSLDSRASSIYYYHFLTSNLFLNHHVYLCGSPMFLVTMLFPIDIIYNK